MIKSYFKIVFRSFLKNKASTLINLIGLSIAFCLFILLMLYVNNELTTDHHHRNRDRIFRIIELNKNSSKTSSKLASLLSLNYFEVEQSCRTINLSGDIIYENHVFSFRQMCIADPNYFKIFDYKLIQGDLNNALLGENGLVLTKSYAKTLFGNENPIGKVVQLGEVNKWNKTGYSLIVKAIIEDIPPNSSLKVDGFISFNILEQTAPYLLNNDDILSFTTWILLYPNADKEKIIKQLNPSSQAKNYNSEQIDLQPLNEIFFGKIRDDLRHGNIQLVYLYAALASFIVFMACINYINLANAQASSRAKEIRIRKILGVDKPKLLVQLLSETTFLIFISIILGFLLAEFFISYFNLIASTDFKVRIFYQFKYLMAIIPGIIMLGILSGLYPAVVLINYPPIDIIKNRLNKSGGGLYVRRWLLIFQFVISLIMIFGTIVIFRQLDYVKHIDLGFNKENVINLNVRDNLTKKDNPFKNQIAALSGVDGVAVGNGIPGDIRRGINTTVKEQKISMKWLMVDENYLKLLNIKIIQGEGFTKDSTDMNKTFMVNQSAVKEFSWEDPLSIKIWDKKCVGVVEDFNFESVHQPITPLFITYESYMSELCIKYTGVNIDNLLDSIEKIWINNYPNRPFKYRFVDAIIEAQYKTEEQLSKIISNFAIISILIASLGIMGLTLFIVNKRTREIGIRKIMGSSSFRIIQMIILDFVKLIVIAFIIFVPLGWYLADYWLKNFSYQTTIAWWIFAISGLLLLLISIVSIRGQAYRVTSMNPVDTLRYE